MAYTWGADGLVSEHFFGAPPDGEPQRASLWYHFGPQGETRQLTDASGNVADSYQYTAYGIMTESTGSDVNPYRYGGQFGYYAPFASNFYLCGLRWYDGDAGRFLSRDPIGYDGGDNLYAYCDGDPVDLADPSGMDPPDASSSSSEDPDDAQEAAEGDESARIHQYLHHPTGGSGPDGMYEGYSGGQGPNGDGIDVVGGLEKGLAWLDRNAKGAYNAVRDAVCPYSGLQDTKGVGPDKGFTAKQKQAMVSVNREGNGGVLRSDGNGIPLVPAKKSMRGVTPAPNEAQIDHIIPRRPRDPNVSPGTNSYSNARIISRAENRAKSNKCK